MLRSSNLPKVHLPSIGLALAGEVILQKAHQVLERFDVLARGAQIRPAVGNRYHYLAAHHLPLQVRIGIPVTSFRTGVLACAVVQSASGRRRH